MQLLPGALESYGSRMGKGFGQSQMWAFGSNASSVTYSWGNLSLWLTLLLYVGGRKITINTRGLVLRDHLPHSHPPLPSGCGKGPMGTRHALPLALSLKVQHSLWVGGGGLGEQEMFIKWASFKKIRTQIECYCVVFLCQNNSVLFFIFFVFLSMVSN